MRQIIWIPLLASGFMLAGCTDGVTLPQPVPMRVAGAAARPNTVEAGGPVVILGARSTVSWDGRTAQAYARMESNGNRAEQRLDLQILHEYGMVGSRTFVDPSAYILSAWRSMGTALRYSVAKSCGQTASLHTVHQAAFTIPGTNGFVPLDSKTALSDAVADQPACSSGGGGGGSCEEDYEHMEQSAISGSPISNCGGLENGGTAGSPSQPEEETWIEEMFGVRFRCSRSTDETFEVVTCVTEEQ